MSENPIRKIIRTCCPGSPPEHQIKLESGEVLGLETFFKIRVEEGYSIEEARVELQSVLGITVDVVSGGVELDLSKVLLNYDELMKVDVPERKRYLPWLKEKAITMIAAARGCGKTNFALGVALALTTETPFLKWPTVEPVGVLYVDGEMQLDELKNRVRALRPPTTEDSNAIAPFKAPLVFLASELFFQTYERDLTLTAPAMQGKIDEILLARPELKVLVLDNVSCLFPGLDENAKRDWEPINAWYIRLRHRGISVIFVHHFGKNATQRGTSTREDPIDVTIELSRPGDALASQGCVFNLHFTKHRGVFGEIIDPINVRLEPQTNTWSTWTWRDVQTSLKEKIKKLLAEGWSQRDIAEELKISKGYVSQLVKKIKKEEGEDDSL